MKYNRRLQRVKLSKMAYMLLLTAFLFLCAFPMQASAYVLHKHYDEIDTYFQQRRFRFAPGETIDFSRYGIDVNEIYLYDDLNEKGSSQKIGVVYTEDNTFTVPEYTGQGEGFVCWIADMKWTQTGTTERGIQLTTATREESYPIFYLDEEGKEGTFENSFLNPDCYYEGEALPTLLDPVKEGFRFEGWYRDQEFTKAFEGIGKNERGEIFLYAKFVKDESLVPIIYETNGGTNSPFNARYANDGKEHKCYPAYKQGYVFTGWSTDPGFTDGIFTLSGARNAPLTLYARYEENVDIVPMPCPDPAIQGYGKGSLSSCYDPICDYVLPEATYSTSTADTYTFLGWYLDPSLSPESRIKAIKAGSSGAYVIYPDFVKNDYAITYENCTDQGDNPNYFSSGRELILAPGSLGGAKFEGWYADADFKTPVTSIKAGQTENVTLYGKFTPYDHAITYTYHPETKDDAKACSNLYMNPSGYDEKEGIASLLPAYVDHPGLFEFEGWYMLQSDGTYTKVESVPKNSKEDLVLYARIERKIYQIQYELNGGKLVPEDASTTIRSDGSDPKGEAGVKMTVPKASKTGYTFRNWVKEDGTLLSSFSSSITSDLKLYAGYRLTINDVPVFEPGDEPADDRKPTGLPGWFTTMTVSSGFTEPKLEGYEFAGFYLDEACTQEITWHQNGWETYTRYVKFVKVKTDQKISYVLPEGAEAPTSLPTQYYPLSGSGKLDKPTVTAEDMEFDGWYLDPGYQRKIDAIPAGLQGDITVYGKVRRKRTTVRFRHFPYDEVIPSYYDRVVYPDDITVENGSRDIILPDAYCEDHLFMGWYKSTSSDETRVERILKEDQKGERTIEVIPKFYRLNGTIRYELDGGENSVNNPTRYATKLGVASFGPALKPGYLFTGWLEKDLYGTNPITGIPANDYKISRTLIATYEKTRYAITYHLNGGFIPATNPSGYNSGNEEIVLAPAERFSGTFLGWYTDPGFAEDSKITRIPANSTRDYDLYAKFQSVISPIAYKPDGTGTANPASYEEGIGVPALTEGKLNDLSFEGWFAEPVFRRQVTAILPEETGEKTLYGKFKGTITYVTGKGKNNPRNQETFLYGSGCRLYPASLSGCTFEGWYADEKLTRRIDYVSSTQDHNLTLYAAFIDAGDSPVIDKPDKPGQGTEIEDPESGKDETGSSQKEQEPTGAVPKKKGTILKDAKGEHAYIVTDDDPSHPEVSYYRCLKKKAKSVKVKKSFTEGGITYGVTGIYAKAFQKCKKLRKITIPVGVKKLGNQMFKGCKSLRIIQIRTTKLTKKSVSKKAFTGVSKKVKVKVPSKKRKAYNKLFHKKGLVKKANVR
ncbi:MAG: InlB B-repeat-containing protein [Lachnospiraceae bacterium]|nr:InlB B-repeat-containing protein [Lachnospiraceae bacterium]